YAMFPYNFNWTQSGGVQTLAPSTKNLLASLREPTTVYVTVSDGNPIYPDLRNLLQNAQAHTNLLRVRYVAPDRQGGFDLYQKLRINFERYFGGVEVRGKQTGRGLLLVKGEHDLDAGAALDAKKEPVEKTNVSAFIPESKLSEEQFARDPKGKSTFTF